jgi:uncharacterized protein YegP (UPF0339 family)
MNRDGETMKIKVQVFQGKDGWRVRLRSRNGEVLMTGESYKRKWNAMRAGGKLAKALGTSATVIS